MDPEKSRSTHPFRRPHFRASSSSVSSWLAGSHGAKENRACQALKKPAHGRGGVSRFWILRRKLLWSGKLVGAWLQYFDFRSRSEFVGGWGEIHLGVHRLFPSDGLS